MARVSQQLVTLYQILETGERLLSEEEIDPLLQSRSVLLRSLSAEALAYYPSHFSQPHLMRLLRDPNGDVRSSAAIAMEHHGSAAVNEMLWDAFLHDTDPLVRGYAGYSFLMTSESPECAATALEEGLTAERNAFVRVICCGGLYELTGTEKHLKQILCGVQSKNYRARCAVANVLLGVLDEENAREILTFSEKVLARERIRAVSSQFDVLKTAAEQLCE